MASFQNLNIADNLKEILVDNSNNSIAQQTWSAYKTAERKLMAFSEETNIPVALPLTEDTVLAFSAWILNSGVSASTLETYLSGIRMTHLAAGENPPQLRTPLVSAVIQGKKNKDNIKKRAGLTPTRLPITPSLLKLMKLELADLNMKNKDKKMIWAAATMAFSGGLRGGEFLAKESMSFDPTTTLREKDLSLDSFTVNGKDEEILKLKLKAEKQNKTSRITICDIYPSASSICPVRAYKKWLEAKSHFSPDMPAFRFDSGENLTINSFNKLLKTIFSKHLTGLNGVISSHSFRIGLASCLGSLGFAEERIMSAGRWSSRAYQAYLKLPRTKRLEMARAISNITDI